jgi:hypothetical protein
VRLRLRLALPLAALLLAIGAGPAQAWTAEGLYDRLLASGDPAATWASWSKAQRAAVRDCCLDVAKVRTVGGVTPTEAATATAAAVTCWERWQGATAYGLLGNRLWSWRMSVEWCGDGSRIVWSTARRWGETYAPFWSWREVSFDRTVALWALPQRVTMFAQAEFKLCAFADIGCIGYRYPWIEGRFWATGSWRWAIGG